MINRITFLLPEFIILFILLPLSLLLHIAPFIKVTLILLGVIYCIGISVRFRLFSFRSLYEIQFINHWKAIAIKLLVLILGSSFLMYFLYPDNLFIVIKQRPFLWAGISLFYTFFSVFPQEFLYRSFFFTRYQEIFKTPNLLIVVNALVFSLAHVVFQNLLVSILTLVGGLVLAITYQKSKSLMLTSIEHALYGIWIFTVGMGEMLAFPSP